MRQNLLLRHATATINAENLRQYKLRFCLTVEQILAFASHTNTVREVKNLSPNFKQIAWLCFILSNIFIWIIRSVLPLTLNSFTKLLWYNKFTRHDQVCFERYLSHHRAITRWSEKYFSKDSLIKHTFSWRDKLIILWKLNRKAKKISLRKFEQKFYSNR